MRARDALGRPVAVGSPLAVEPVPEAPLPPDEALETAQRLLDQGRAFSAHEVLEASWKAAPARERATWQGLAQVCVGLTHLQRGNLVGAARLLRRGAGNLGDHPVAAQAVAAAERVEAGDADPPSITLRGCGSPPP